MTSFYALLSRMRYIDRWGLMRSSIPENVQEHTCETAMLAHALGVIRQEIFHIPCNADRLAVLALYHDASEILTGDLPTPIKYHNNGIRNAYKEVEHAAQAKILDLLPEELRERYRTAVEESDAELQPLVKAADKLSALIKCIEERKAGNGDFASAEQQTRESLTALNLPEVDWFLLNALPAYELNLDELGVMYNG